jgi:hypothetical protein
MLSALGISADNGPLQAALALVAKVDDGFEAVRDRESGVVCSCRVFPFIGGVSVV